RGLLVRPLLLLDRPLQQLVVDVDAALRLVVADRVDHAPRVEADEREPRGDLDGLEPAHRYGIVEGHVVRANAVLVHQEVPDADAGPEGDQLAAAEQRGLDRLAVLQLIDAERQDGVPERRRAIDAQALDARLELLALL